MKHYTVKKGLLFSLFYSVATNNRAHLLRTVMMRVLAMLVPRMSRGMRPPYRGMSSTC